VTKNEDISKCFEGVTFDSDIEIDKSWMQEPTRCSDRYLKGGEEFLRMTRQCVDVNGIMMCLYHDCSNRYFCYIELNHLYRYGIDCAYTR
jgi:hypothetical protein